MQVRTLPHNSDREYVTASLTHSVILAKHFGVEKLRGIRCYYQQYQIPKSGILRKALIMYMKQTVPDISDESEILKELCDGYSWSIPLFPYRMQLVALWKQETNWRVLQASAHADAYWSLLGTDLTPLHQLDTKPCNTFDYYSNIARDEFAEETHPGCIGAVLESVRSLLGEWQVGTTQEVEWEPTVPLESLDFRIPVNILNGCYDRELQERMIWANLRDGMVTLCLLRTDDDGRVVETSCVEVWTGWPPFDVHICKFEMEQWLKACDIDLAGHHLLSEDVENWGRFKEVDDEIERAEKVIELVVFAQMEAVGDDAIE